MDIPAVLLDHKEDREHWQAFRETVLEQGKQNPSLVTLGRTVFEQEQSIAALRTKFETLLPGFWDEEDIDLQLGIPHLDKNTMADIALHAHVAARERLTKQMELLLDQLSTAIVPRAAEKSQQELAEIDVNLLLLEEQISGATRKVLRSLKDKHQRLTKRRAYILEKRDHPTIPDEIRDHWKDHMHTHVQKVREQAAILLSLILEAASLEPSKRVRVTLRSGEPSKDTIQAFKNIALSINQENAAVVQPHTDAFVAAETTGAFDNGVKINDVSSNAEVMLLASIPASIRSEAQNVTHRLRERLTHCKELVPALRSFFSDQIYDPYDTQVTFDDHTLQGDEGRFLRKQCRELIRICHHLPIQKRLMFIRRIEAEVGLQFDENMVHSIADQAQLGVQGTTLYAQAAQNILSSFINNTMRLSSMGKTITYETGLTEFDSSVSCMMLEPSMRSLQNLYDRTPTMSRQPMLSAFTQRLSHPSIALNVQEGITHAIKEIASLLQKHEEQSPLWTVYRNALESFTYPHNATKKIALHTEQKHLLSDLQLLLDSINVLFVIRSELHPNECKQFARTVEDAVQLGMQ